MSMNKFSKDIHNKANEIGREILAKMAENAGTLVPDVPEGNEDQQKLQEKALDFGNSIVQYLATKDIPAQYATMAIDKIVDGLTGLKTFVDGTLRMYEDEYLSRSFGIKNEDGKYRREMATISDLVLNLEKVREATGNDRGDFFNDVAPKMPEPEAPIPSPFAAPTE